MLKRHGGEKLSVKVDGKRVKQGKWDSRELEGGEKVTVKDGRNIYEKHEVQATVIEPKLKVEGTGAIEYVQTWGVQGRSEVWVGDAVGQDARPRRGCALPPIASLRAPAWRPRATKSTWR